MNTEQLIDNLADKMEVSPPAASPAVLFSRWILVSALYIAISGFFMGVRPDFTVKLHAPFFAAEIMMLMAIIITSLGSAALLSFPDIYQKKRLAFLPVLAFVVFTVVIAAAYVTDNPPSQKPSHAMECLLCICMLSIIPGILVFYTIRKSATTHYYTAGAIAVLAAFSIGALILRISEQTDSMEHLLTWHYLPMIGAGIIGILAGRLFLKW